MKNKKQLPRRKITVTVGIPAYNEAANIATLLRNLLNQNLEHLVLKHIVVISDASEDATVAVAKTVVDDRIRIIRGGKRCGQCYRQNQIFNLASTDVVVLLNADILPAGNNFLQEICRPLLLGSRIGLVGARVVPLSLGNSFISRVLDWHHIWKNALFEQINEGDTVYLCHGRARAFSKKLYRLLRWPNIAGEDAYSYIQAKQLGFDFVFAPKAVVWYASPQTMVDHMRQSVRFFLFRSFDTLQNTAFQQTNWYYIPRYLLVKSALFAALANPLYAVTYGCMMIGTMGLCLFTAQRKQNPLWSVSVSTKTLAVPQ